MSTVAADELRLLIERAERLEDEKRAIADDIKDVLTEAKSRGYDPKAIRAIMAIRRKKKEVYQEEQAILDTYMHALGMDFASTPLGASVADRDPLGSSSIQEAIRRTVDAVNDGALGPNVTAFVPGDPSDDELYAQAVSLVVDNQKASTSWLQRQLRLGYNSAARLVERMEREGIVGRPNHLGAREVLRESSEAMAAE